MTTEESKAVAETAKLGQEVIKAGVGAGGWLARIVGSVPEDLIGIMGGDWLHHARKRNIATLEANTAVHLEKVERVRLTEPSPSLLLPLLQAAVDVSQEELQALWAALLANTVTDGGKRVRTAFFEVVRKLEPVDAQVILIVQEYPAAQQAGRVAYETPQHWMVNQASGIGISGDDFAVALEALGHLNCTWTDHNGTPRLTAFCRSMLKACAAPPAEDT